MYLKSSRDKNFFSLLLQFHPSGFITIWHFVFRCLFRSGCFQIGRSHWAAFDFLLCYSSTIFQWVLRVGYKSLADLKFPWALS